VSTRDGKAFGGAPRLPCETQRRHGMGRIASLDRRAHFLLFDGHACRHATAKPSAARRGSPAKPRARLGGRFNIGERAALGRKEQLLASRTSTPKALPQLARTVTIKTQVDQARFARSLGGGLFERVLERRHFFGA
jgi:hypothetical protein